MKFPAPRDASGDPGSPNPPSQAGPPDDGAVGLPFFRSWRAVYLFVLITFAAWIGLLTILTLAFP
jgi:hypothetical protein